MGVKIVSRRKVPDDKEAMAFPLIRQLQQIAKKQPGYRSEETWRNVVRKDEYLIVREWSSEDEWYEWQSSPERVQIQREIESLLGEKTHYELYDIVQRTEK